MNPRSRRLVPILGASALTAVAAAALVGPGASAQGGRTLTMTELDKGSRFAHIRNTKTKSPRANSLGDVIAFTNPVVQAGEPAGRLYVECVTTAGARNFLKSTLTCSGVLVLRDGTLTLQANTSPGDDTTTAAVTGGTGAYANARGVSVSRTVRGGSQTTITLAD